MHFQADTYRPSRHDLVWLKPDAAPAAVSAGGQPVAPDQAMQHLLAWVAQGNPLIVARQTDLNTLTNTLRVGLALPPSQGKLRLAFDVPAFAIDRVQSPPKLAEIDQQLPPNWAEATAALLADAAIRRCQPALYGSLAIELLSQQVCTSVKSDIDLLFYPPDDQAYVQLLRALSQFAERHPQLTIDGEIINAHGWASAWRDCACGQDRVLAKSIHAVTLLKRNQFEQWPCGEEAA